MLNAESICGRPWMSSRNPILGFPLLSSHGSSNTCDRVYGGAIRGRVGDAFELNSVNGADSKGDGSRDAGAEREEGDKGLGEDEDCGCYGITLAYSIFQSDRTTHVTVNLTWVVVILRFFQANHSPYTKTGYQTGLTAGCGSGRWDASHRTLPTKKSTPLRIE